LLQKVIDTKLKWSIGYILEDNLNYDLVGQL
jgi:hypothetical protein